MVKTQVRPVWAAGADLGEGPGVGRARIGALVRRHQGLPPASLAPIERRASQLEYRGASGIGAALKRTTRTSMDFLSGRSIPAWIAGLAFISANLGAQEVIGMVTSQFYWIGAIPAMVFLGVFMMPFYYGSRARLVPEYLRLLFDEKTRTLNAVSFAVMTCFPPGSRCMPRRCC